MKIFMFVSKVRAIKRDRGLIHPLIQSLDGHNSELLDQTKAKS